MMQRNIVNDTKVTQVASYVVEKCQYHHGESSLYECIINMACNYVTSNNINLINPSGQFGSRRNDIHSAP